MTELMKIARLMRWANNARFCGWRDYCIVRDLTTLAVGEKKSLKLSKWQVGNGITKWNRWCEKNRLAVAVILQDLKNYLGVKA